MDTLNLVWPLCLFRQNANILHHCKSILIRNEVSTLRPTTSSLPSPSPTASLDSWWNNSSSIILVNMTLCFKSPRLWHKYAQKYLRRWPVGTFLANPTKLKILKIKVMPFSATYEGMERAWIFGEVKSRLRVLFFSYTLGEDLSH